MVDIQTFMDMFHVFCFGLVTGFALIGLILILIMDGKISPKVLGAPDYKPPEGGIFGNKEKEVMKDV